MKEPNLFEKIQVFFTYNLRQYFCSHKKIALATGAKYLEKGYCDYYAKCENCDKSFRVIIYE